MFFGSRAGRPSQQCQSKPCQTSSSEQLRLPLSKGATLLHYYSTTPAVAVARGTYIMSREYPWNVNLLLKLPTMSLFVIWHGMQPIRKLCSPDAAHALACLIKRMWIS
mmetsp:Transcript_6052/g.11033  ORF Transcript_6052/g.11033 Transcript_6052/m.11033 type:complete len:108 (+) Transcript_6052:413-736(+)